MEILVKICAETAVPKGLNPVVRSRRGVLTALFLLLAQGEATAAKHEKLRLPWNELERVVAGKMVEFILPDGTAIKGRVVGFTSETLLVDIKKKSGGAVYKRGQASIPRSSVTTLQTKEMRGSWRAIGTAAGAAAGGTAGALAYRRFSNEGFVQTGVGAASGIIGAAAAIGFFAGRTADTRVTTITVIKESTTLSSLKPSGADQSHERDSRSTRCTLKAASVLEVGCVYTRVGRRR
jgi:hypothetical protein